MEILPLRRPLPWRLGSELQAWVTNQERIFASFLNFHPQKADWIRSFPFAPFNYLCMETGSYTLECRGWWGYFFLLRVRGSCPVEGSSTELQHTHRTIAVFPLALSWDFALLSSCPDTICAFLWAGCAAQAQCCNPIVLGICRTGPHDSRAKVNCDMGCLWMSAFILCQVPWNKVT